MSDQDPTRPQQPVPGEPVPGEPAPPHEPTSVIRTETETVPRDPVPPGPPTGGAVSTGVAIGAALVVGLLGLLLGYLLFGGDDDDAVDDDQVVQEAPDDTVDPALEAERDELAAQVDDLNAQVQDLQTQLEEVTRERDELQAQLDEQGDQVETVEAPDVTNGSVDQAEDVANDNGWVLVERAVDPGGNEPGTIVAQYPDPGSPMIEGSVLVIDVAGEPDGG